RWRKEVEAAERKEHFRNTSRTGSANLQTPQPMRFKVFCEAVPKWKWMLSTWPFSSLMSRGLDDREWLDRRLYRLLADCGDGDNDRILCGDAIAAIVHRHQQDAIFESLMLTEFPEQARGPVRCPLLASTTDTSHLQGNIK
ncbi:hypothetical protein TSMEX_002854, partial [Taenia solium]